MAKKLFVRFSTSQDEKKIFDYYKENQHKYVFQRDADVWKERISSGAVTLIEDEAGKIVASSISYPVMMKDAKGDDVHQFTEIGSVRVALDGIGLGKTLVSAQVLRAYLFEPPKERFILDIVVGNEASRAMFAKLGATLHDLPAALKKKPEEKTTTSVGGKGASPVDWFQIGPEAIPNLANNLLEREKNPAVVNKATGEEYEIDFSKCMLMTQFKNELKQVAQQDLGNAAKPDYRHTVAAMRNKLKH